jgi:hypothetical protein
VQVSSFNPAICQIVDKGHLRKLSRFEWLQCCFKPEMEKARLIGLCNFLQDNLRTLHLSPREAQGDDTLIKVHQFVNKSIPRRYMVVKEIHACSKEVFARKLGLTSEILDANPGFYIVIRGATLYNYLAKYKESLQICPDTQKILIKTRISEGESQYLPWDSGSVFRVHEGQVQIKHQMTGDFVRWDPMKPQDFLAKNETVDGTEDVFCQPWYYGPDGLQLEDMFNTLMPVKRKKYERHFFALAATCSQTAIKEGPHGLYYLNTTDAKYCYSKYRPGKMEKTPAWVKYVPIIGKAVSLFVHAPLRWKRGKIMVDVTYFWGIKPVKIKFETTKEKVEEILERNRQDRVTEATESQYHVVIDNCTDDAYQKAQMAGLEIPDVRCHVYRLLFPNKLLQAIDASSAVLPSSVNKLGRLSITIFFNVVTALFGGCVVDRSVLAVKPETKPIIRSLRDFLKEANVMTVHPHPLLFKFKPIIDEWQRGQDEGYKCAIPPPSIFSEAKQG